MVFTSEAGEEFQSSRKRQFLLLHFKTCIECVFFCGKLLVVALVAFFHKNVAIKYT